jgi:nitroreductase
MGSQFHSNLMRQIMATARHQARPPVALMGWINELDNNDDVNHNGSGSSTAADSFTAPFLGRQGTPSASAARAVQVHLQRRTSPGGREYYEHLPIPSSSEVNYSVAQHPTAASALGTTSTSCGSSSFYDLHAAAASWAAAPATAPAAATATTARNGPSEDASSDLLGDEEEQAEGRGVKALHPTADGIPRTEEELPQLFQNLILTRRTRSHFAPMTATSDDSREDGIISADGSTRRFWTSALDRAVLCGYAAPNHRRTEPFTFRRLVAPSSKTRDLADLAYHVQLRKLQLQRRRKEEQQEDQSDCRSEDASGSATTQAEADDARSARRKHDKWNQIPAFLVATVKSPSVIQGEGEGEGGLSEPSNSWRYEPIEYKAPATIRELEDYASCCAAVQNVLLSLHSEGLASKWATGDVIRTPAFRHLMEIPDDDRVVALIQVGRPPAATASAQAACAPEVQPQSQPVRRHRRPLKGDVLVDL